MDNKAQLSLEALLLLAVLLLVATWLISTLTKTSSRAESKVETNARHVFKELKG